MGQQCCCQSLNQQSQRKESAQLINGDELQIQTKVKPHQVRKSILKTQTSQTFGLVEEKKIQRQPTLDQKMKSRGFINIFYATTSGNSSRLASNLMQESMGNNYIPKLIHITDFDPSQFPQLITPSIFLFSTYGQGGPTADAEQFFSWLQLQKDNSLLKNLKYCLFALGNSTFENFCGMGVKTDAKFKELGAQSIYKMGKGDANGEKTNDDFDKWKENLWHELNILYPQQEITIQQLYEQSSNYTIEKNENTKEMNIDDISDYDSYEAKLTEFFKAKKLLINEITQTQNRLNIELDLKSSNFTYKTAGNIVVYAENDDNSIKEFAEKLKLDLDEVFVLKKKQQSSKLPFPTPIRVYTFLQKFCDFKGPVNKLQVQALIMYTKYEKDSLFLQECIKDTQKFTSLISEKKHSLFSLIFLYKIKIPFDILVQISTRIYPRYYTISSSSAVNSRQLSFCVSLHSFDNHENQKVSGLASEYFKYLKKGQKIKCQFTESAFSKSFDFNKNNPHVFIGPGAGIAPFRAFLLEKEFLKKSKSDCYVYFGCKTEQDFIYKNDLERFQKNNTCKSLKVAFSREGNKEHVQDLLNNDIDLLGEVLIDKQGILCICGSIKMGEDIKNLIVKIFQEKGQIMPYEAFLKVQEMEAQNRFLMEIWG